MNGSLSLTPRERQIIDLAAAGKSDVDTAEALGLTPHTVRSYWRNLRRKLRASSRGQIIARVLGDAVTPDQRGAAGESLLQPVPVDLDSLREAGVSETILSAVALSLNVAMVIAWGSSGQIVFCNAITERLLLREIQLPGAVDWQGFRRPGLPLTLEEYPLGRALKGEEHVVDDLYFMRGDGTLTFLRVQAVPIRASGQIVGAVAVAWPLPAPDASSA